MASYGGLEGILTGLTKSTDHPSISTLDLQTPGLKAYVKLLAWSLPSCNGPRL